MSLLAVIIGGITGFISAFFGLGGSSIDTPLLRLFLGLPPLEALATPLPLTVLTASIAFLTYRKEDFVNWRMAGWSLAGAAPGMIIGAILTRWIPGRPLMLLTAAVLFLVGADFIVKDLTARRFAREETPGRRASVMRIVAVTFPIGILSGVLANGGGIFLIPAFVIVFGLTFKHAIATSLAVVAVVAVPGSVVHIALGHVNFPVLGAMAIGILPMAWLGARADIRTRSKTLLLLFGLMMTGFSIYFFFSELWG